METELPKRKSCRIPGYDYSQNGAYFITICTHQKRLLFGNLSRESAPTVVEIVQTFKRYSTIEYIHLVKQGAAEPFEKYVWQRSFHDHIVRTEDDFRMIAEYIQNNPRRWEEDCFHPTKNPPTKEPPP